ncbi:FMN-binding protein [Roseateles saccharophilus]|uniref:Na+-translocating ferredoxin:NAD+ oxidoreductase RnfG subunit n=1 Tax=Roseateles saccharophilus TaxID=304 RepID=A0A4R3V9T5_ROSSA|nr:FMN-binding protein [Roseateles saccharophilus]MDG0832567.1 FMN-binding protein [Roseateles saccharophilus]TCV00304.1 Na+-translocating ferredoxin:NAD+ oxidoreductase RnfG subunit [Roseateles saccharophilus]
MGTLHWLPLALAAPALVQAAQIATLDEAAKRAFPEATAWRDQLVQASADDMRALAALGGAAPRASTWRSLVALKGEQVLGVVVADGVIGKFELIDYAVAVGSDGRIRSVEVLNYRESHGYEIKLPAWRKQFAGKNAQAPLRVGDDIANISGATLSCSHVADGVRHIVALLERLRASGRL